MSIEKLKNEQVGYKCNGEFVCTGVKPPNEQTIVDKINEIIDVLNELQAKNSSD